MSNPDFSTKSVFHINFNDWSRGDSNHIVMSESAIKWRYFALNTSLLLNSRLYVVA